MRRRSKRLQEVAYKNIFWNERREELGYKNNWYGDLSDHD